MAFHSGRNGMCHSILARMKHFTLAHSGTFHSKLFILNFWTTAFLCLQCPFKHPLTHSEIPLTKSTEYSLSSKVSIGTKIWVCDCWIICSKSIVPGLYKYWDWEWKYFVSVSLDACFVLLLSLHQYCYYVCFVHVHIYIFDILNHFSWTYF